MSESSAETPTPPVHGLVALWKALINVMRWLEKAIAVPLRIIDSLLLLLIFLVLSSFILLLVQSGSGSLAIAVGIVGSVTTLVVPLLNWFRGNADKMPIGKTISAYVNFGIRLILLCIALVGGIELLHVVGKQLFEQGLRETAIIDVQRDLNEASVLGIDVGSELETRIADLLTIEPSLQQSKDSSSIWAQVYLSFEFDPVRRQDFASSLAQNQACPSLLDLALPQAENALRVIAIIDPPTAAEMVIDANNAAIQEQFHGQPQTFTQCQDLIMKGDPDSAFSYLTFARDGEELVGRNLKTGVRSLIHENLAYVEIKLAPKDTTLADATSLYWDALRLNPDNYQARYELADLLIQTADLQPDKAKALRDAADIAHVGWYQNVDCIITDAPATKDPADFTPLYDCFNLKVTEFAARYAMKEDMSTIKPWLTDAIGLAESPRFQTYLAMTDNQYNYIGEAYYYQALLDGDKADPQVVCKIELNADQDDLEQQSWNAWAQDWTQQHSFTCPAT